MSGHVYRDGNYCGVCGKGITYALGAFECRYPNQQGRVHYNLCLDCMRMVHGFIRTAESQFKTPDDEPMKRPRGRVEGWTKPGASVPDLVKNRA